MENKHRLPRRCLHQKEILFVPGLSVCRGCVVFLHMLRRIAGLRPVSYTHLVTHLQEYPGYGLEGVIEGKNVLVGNIRLLTDRGITVPAGISERVATVVVCAIAGKYAGHLLLSDTLKADAVEAIGRLKQLHIDNIQLLSGDKKEIVAIFALSLIHIFRSEE